MAVLPPNIQTYHCICTSLLLASTHVLSTLPRRAAPSLDGAYLLPVPAQPPNFSTSSSPGPEAEAQDGEEAEDQDQEAMEGVRQEKEEKKDMPTEGYTMLLGMQKDSKVTIIRREDGFEKRSLWRCGRCNLVVGYEITGSESLASVSATGADSEKGKGEEGFEGKVVYILPNGILGTQAMASGKKIGEGDVEIGEGKGVGIWE
jgi:hypothetical protein